MEVTKLKENLSTLSDARANVSNKKVLLLFINIIDYLISYVLTIE